MIPPSRRSGGAANRRPRSSPAWDGALRHWRASRCGSRRDDKGVAASARGGARCALGREIPGWRGSRVPYRTPTPGMKGPQNDTSLACPVPPFVGLDVTYANRVSARLGREQTAVVSKPRTPQAGTRPDHIRRCACTRRIRCVDGRMPPAAVEPGVTRLAVRPTHVRATPRGSRLRCRQ